MLGIEESFFQVYLIDFGLSKRYIDPQTNKHIAMKTGKTLLGAVEYASINNHEGKELGRRDDLEAFAYIMCHLLLGDLPWSGLVGNDKPQENEARVLAMKAKFTESEQFKSLPLEIREFLIAARALGFDEDPKYTEYRRKFKMLMVREGNTFDYIYDWILLPVTQQINRQLNAIDDTLNIEDSLTQEEKEEIEDLMRKYENDPTVLDFRLEEIRKQNKKFDVVSPNISAGASLINDKQGNKGKKDAAGSKKGKKGDKKDCTLI